MSKENSQLAKKVIFASQYVTADKPETFIWGKLAELGINDDDISYDILMSDSSKEGDFRKVFCESKPNLPLPRFRKVWEILREGAEENKEIKSSFSDISALASSLKSIGQWSDKDLLEKYSQDDCSNQVEKELKERSCGRNFIVFNEDKTINTELTLNFLREARRRDLPKTFNDGNKTYLLYPAGEFPNEVYDVCPVTGDILLNDYSEKIGVKWDMSLEGRQFVWIMKDQGIETSALSLRDIQKLFKEEGLVGLKSLYPNVGVIFEDLKVEGKLPTLKTKLSSRKKLDPFSSKRY